MTSKPSKAVPFKMFPKKRTLLDIDFGISGEISIVVTLTVLILSSVFPPVISSIGNKDFSSNSGLNLFLGDGPNSETSSGNQLSSRNSFVNEVNSGHHHRHRHNHGNALQTAPVGGY